MDYCFNDSSYSQLWSHPFWSYLLQLRTESGMIMSSEKKCSQSSQSRNNFEEVTERESLCIKIAHLILRFADFNSPVCIMKRKDWCNIEFDENFGVHVKENPIRYATIRPLKQAQTLNFLCRVYSLLKNNRCQTKRDLFYRDVSLYRSQFILNNIVEDVCCILQTTRRRLHILTTSKGLIYGNVTITIDGIEHNCTSIQTGFVIPHDLSGIEKVESDAKFILVVEKDATFQHFINSRLIEKLPVVMITGKGFPDNNTREVLKFMTEKLLIPALVLVDCDPFGIEILCIYRYGSLAMAHNALNTVTPQIRWLGLHPKDILRWKIPRYAQRALSKRDQSKIGELETRPYIKSNIAWADQVQMLKSSGLKAEMQVLLELDDNFLVTTYIPMKIQEGDWL